MIVLTRTVIPASVFDKFSLTSKCTITAAAALVV